MTFQNTDSYAGLTFSMDCDGTTLYSHYFNKQQSGSATVVTPKHCGQLNFVGKNADWIHSATLQARWTMEQLYYECCEGASQCTAPYDDPYTYTQYAVGNNVYCWQSGECVTVDDAANNKYVLCTVDPANTCPSDYSASPAPSPSSSPSNNWWWSASNSPYPSESSQWMYSPSQSPQPESHGTDTGVHSPFD